MAERETQHPHESPRVRGLYLRLYDRVLVRPALVLGAVAVVSLASAVLVPRISLDMSFRPLFGQDRSALEATRRFEERFGQRSGAFVGAILAPDVWDRDFVEGLARASADVEAVEGVVEVISLARAALPVWSPEGVEPRWLIDPSMLESVSDAELGRVLEARGSPGVRRTLVSPDGRRTVLLARLGVPLQDLDRRARIIRSVQEVVRERLGGSAGQQWVGISVVEAAYARLVLSGLALSLFLTTAVLLGALYAVYRRAASVAAIMAGVSSSLPIAVAVMVARGQSITIVNSMVPTMILIIGVADAIHMFECFAEHVRAGLPRREAVREMFGDMALPCLLTSLTTIAGVLALETARIEALRDFGSNVAIGIATVYMANVLALPALLRLLPLDAVLAPRVGSSVAGPRGLAARFETWKRDTSALLVRKSGSVVTASGVVVVLCALGARLLDVDQRFNEDVAPEHPVRIAQATYERDFTGILGPDVVIHRRDGAPILEVGDRARLSNAIAAIEALPGVIQVTSVLDVVPPDIDVEEARRGLARMRGDERLQYRARDVVDADVTQTAIVVRTEDVGSRAALRLVDRIEEVTARALGDAYEAEVVGQWWLAQLGLSELLRDMLVGFTTSFVLVLPILGLALGSLELFAVAVVPNLLPPFFALGFMGWTGISVRVGTAMILAIALAIAVDDTIHVLVRIGRERDRSSDPRDHVRGAIEHTAGPVLLTTAVLVAGFLSMRANGLVAIQDMGLVAGATLTVACLADVYFLPALYLVASTARRPTWAVGRRYVERRIEGTASSPDVSRGQGSEPPGAEEETSGTWIRR